MSSLDLSACVLSNNDVYHCGISLAVIYVSWLDFKSARHMSSSLIMVNNTGKSSSGWADELIAFNVTMLAHLTSCDLARLRRYVVRLASKDYEIKRTYWPQICRRITKLLLSVFIT